MGLTLNIIFIVFYTLSIFNLGIGILKMSVSYGDVRSAEQARIYFVTSVLLFVVMSVLMVLRFSLWFGIPVILLFVLPIGYVFFEEIKDMLITRKSLKKKNLYGLLFMGELLKK